MKIKAFKGFKNDMTCRDFQYEEGKTYETDAVSICDCGFHACLLPLDCLEYYASKSDVYHEVEIDGLYSFKSMFLNSNTKIAATKITIGKEISVAEMKKYEENLLQDESEMDKFLKPFTTFDKSGKKYITKLIRNYIKYRGRADIKLEYNNTIADYYLANSDGFYSSIRGLDFPYDEPVPKRPSDVYFLILDSLTWR